MTNEIAAVLANYSPDCRPAQVEALGGAGGLSGASFWRLTSARGTLALRRWPAEHPSPARLNWIHQVLRHAVGHGFGLIAPPIIASGGASFVEQAGRLWELAAWLPGSGLAEDASAAQRLAAVQTLADFHRATEDFTPRPAVGPSPGIAARLAALQQLVAGGFDELAAAANSGEAGWTELRLAAGEWLRLARQRASPLAGELLAVATLPVVQQPCLRDARPEHFLFVGDVPSGLIDFGALNWENVAADLARLLGGIAGDDAERWRAGVEAYASARPLPEAERRLAPMFDAANVVLGAANWLRWTLVEKRQFDDPKTVLDRFHGLADRLRLAVGGKRSD